MAYWTKADFRTDVWQVVIAEVPDKILDNAIAIGEGQCNSYLDRSYDVPFTTPGDFIKGLSGILSRYWGQILAGHDITHLHEPDKEAYTQAVDILEQIRDGKIDIPGIDRDASMADKVYSNTMDYYSIFNVDHPLNWRVDSDRLDDISDDRS